MVGLVLTSEQQQLVLDNVSFAEAMTRKILIRPAKFVDVEEAISEAYHGLCIAASRFVPTKNIKFTTYAHFYIFKFVMEYVRRESKRLYGCTKIKDRTEVLCSIESINGESMLGTMDDTVGDLDVIMESLMPQERYVLSYRLAGYTKKEISKELKISIQRVDLSLKEIKKVTSHILEREDLMEEKEFDVVDNEPKKKRGRPRKVNLEISKSGAENFKEEIEQGEPIISVNPIVQKYSVEFDVGQDVYIALFSGERLTNGPSLDRTYKYRPVKTKVTSIVLKQSYTVAYTTVETRKAYVESYLVFKDEQSCKNLCKKLNKE